MNSRDPLRPDSRDLSRSRLSPPIVGNWHLSTRAGVLLSGLLTLAACFGTDGGGGPEPRTGSPNLIVILADDLGYNDVGFTGGEEIPTPHIDSIAQAGVRFTNGYVSYPVCGPSRAGLLTGRYQNRFGFVTNPSLDPSNRDIGIPYDEENIAEVLHGAGYESMIIGKWHMGSHPDQHPLNRGFDQFYGFLSGGHQYFPHLLTLNDLSEVENKWDWYRTRLMRDFDRVDEEQYLTDAFSDEAVDFIDAQAGNDSPFFLYLSYNAPHTPLQATEKYLNRFPHIGDNKRRTYAAMVSALDDGVGIVLEALNRHGIANDTIVVFLSDNGGANGKGSDNTPLRGWKGSQFDGGVRVPFAMQWPGQIPAHIDFDHPVSSLDILGTIAGIAGVAPAQPLDGLNLIPYLKGEKIGAPHDMLMWYNASSGSLAIRASRLKVHGSDGAGGAVAQAAYDAVQDIGETDDILNEIPQGELATDMDAWRAWAGELEPQAFPSLSDVWWE